jgi:hypothetical protein
LPTPEVIAEERDISKGEAATERLMAILETEDDLTELALALSSQLMLKLWNLPL